jgi:uncharacterized membrane protein YvbJ
MATSGSFCTNCGTQNDPSARFCVKCGTATQAAPSGQASGPAPQPAQRDRGFSCPYCATDVTPTVKKQMTPLAWVVFIVLLLVDFLLAPLAFFMREEYRVCRSCGVKLG